MIKALYDNTSTSIVKYTINFEKYEHILGGDGRGMPWSEYRKGHVFKISLSNNIYVSDQNKRKLIEYVKSNVTEFTVVKIDHFFIEE